MESEPGVVFSRWQALRRTFEKPQAAQKTEGGSLTSRTLLRQVLDLIALQ